MWRYLIAFIKNLFNPGVGIATITDTFSSISRLAKTNRLVKILNSSIGRYSYVGNSTWIHDAIIGDFCSIADNVRIGLGSHTASFVSTSPIFTFKRNGTGHSWVEKDLIPKITPPERITKIGNDVWIGSRAIIMSGVKIGDGAIIGAGAIITKDVPPYAVVVGVPGKIIKYRFSDEIINTLLELKWWEYPDKILKNTIYVFQENPTKESLENWRKQIFK